jgi:uncharacterized protein
MNASRSRMARAIWAAVLLCFGVIAARGQAPAKSQAEKPASKTKGNRLSAESSPYLLLHAHNPVDWYPWGEEALAKAKKENKPIFLSIGYSSCYWCHVMERESFMNEEIAALLNKHFVCIKVDREERPDVDEVYMTALQSLGRPGGWPLSMFLTPDARPFFGGTYFPPRDDALNGRPGFLSVGKKVLEVWEKDRDSVNKLADQVVATVKENFATSKTEKPVPLAVALVDAVQADLARQFDAEHGGFGRGQTKFPRESDLVYLLPRVKAGNAEAQNMLMRTLDKMAQGGLRDHLGGGFHRYTVDPRWAIPHFEKMLYDNAQLASIYTEAFLLTGNTEYRRVVDELAEFVLREMTDAGGGFYAALDAETDAMEGKSYIWKREELEKSLAKEEFELFAAIYGIGDHPNFEDQYFVPQLSAPMRETAKKRGLTADALAAQLAPIRVKLLAVRSKRKQPLTDTKILTGWNGMMIRGLADAGRGLKNPRYVQAAERAAEFVLTNSQIAGRLARTHTAGAAKLNAYAEDYALLVDGLLALHEATGKQAWLEKADRLTQEQIERFWDKEHGGFYFTASDHEQVLVRRKDAYDGPVPAANSVSADNLLRLSRALNKPQYADRAAATLRALAGRLQEAPVALPRAAAVLSSYLQAAPPSRK